MQTPRTYSRTVWVSPRALAGELGITTQTLRRNRHDYLEGSDYINVSPKAARPTYRWNREKMLKKFKVKP